MNSSVIRHKGVVKGVNENHVEVMILAESACSSCKSKKVCSISEVKEKLIYIDNPDKKFSIGDQVDVILEEKMGILAILFAYFIPFILMIIILAFGTYFKISEPIMGLGVLLTLTLYYISLYFARNLFSKRMTFKIEKLEVTNLNYHNN